MTILTRKVDKEWHYEIDYHTIDGDHTALCDLKFVNKLGRYGVEVSLDKLYQYGWILFFKNNFNPKENRFLYGNLSPLCPTEISEEFKCAASFYAFNNNALVKKYYSRSDIEREYGVEKKTDILEKSLNNLYLF